MNKIKDIPLFQRPREKLKQKGANALSDTELIAILLGSGTKKKDVFALSSKIAKIISKNKGHISFELLSCINGIGLAKASKIIASFELARRFLVRDTVSITNAGDILPLVNDIRDKQQEYFMCITLTGANEVIEKRIVTVGLLDRSQIHPREVFADVITDRAASVIFAHNHPSGLVKPSSADLKVNKQLEEAGRILGIKVMDNLIVSKKDYYSFQEEGLIKGY